MPEVKLRNTCFLGAREQDIFVVLYTVSNVGCFPPSKEPFGPVFVECMACMTLAQAVPSVAGLENCKRCVTFGGKAAERKRQAALLRATAKYEKDRGRAPEDQGSVPEVELEEHLHSWRSRSGHLG